MTAGFRSTEFWHACVCMVAGLALCCVGLLKTDNSLAITGAALIGVSTIAYAHARGKAKGRPYLPPSGKL